jgi:hypothetical protein
MLGWSNNFKATYLIHRAETAADQISRRVICTNQYRQSVSEENAVILHDE